MTEDDGQTAGSYGQHLPAHTRNPSVLRQLRQQQAAPLQRVQEPVPAAVRLFNHHCSQQTKIPTGPHC